MVTVAGALSDGVVNSSSSFLLPPALQVGDRVIHDAEVRGTERMTVAEILAKSSNIGAVTIGEKLGKQRLLDWIGRFGFGKLTGIDFPGEVQGYVLPGDKWWSSTIGNVPMGQGISVTPIQMVAAYGAIANGGVMMTPYLTAQVGDHVVKHKAGRRIVSAAVAAELRAMLSDVVADGHRHARQDPRLHRRRQDRHRAEGPAQRRRLLHDRLRRLVHRHGARPRSAARGRGGGRSAAPLLGRHGGRTRLLADRGLRPAASRDRSVRAPGFWYHRPA